MSFSSKSPPSFDRGFDDSLSLSSPLASVFETFPSSEGVKVITIRETIRPCQDPIPSIIGVRIIKALKGGEYELALSK